MVRLCVWSSVLILAVAAQSTSSFAQTKARTSTPGSRCQTRIARLDGIGENFTKKTGEELGEIRTFLEGCLQNSYDQLSKHDLSVAGIELVWVQYAIDLIPEEADDDASTTTTSTSVVRSEVTKASAATSTPQGERPVMVKVSPLELGSTFYITFAGQGHTCEVRTTAEVTCKYFPGGSHYNYATQQNETNVAYRTFIAAVFLNNGNKYAIGCVEGDHTCLRPSYGQTWAVIDGSTVRFPAWNVGWTDPKTGRKIDEQPALFTLLGSL